MRDRDVTVLPEALRAWRRERGWSQGELAGRANCSESLIALIETDRRQPGLQNAMGIAKAFGVPLQAIAVVHVDLESLRSEAEESVA